MNRAERDKGQCKTRQKVRLGAGAGYWGAELDAAIKLANEGAIEYLCFDQLAELTMSLLERQRLKNPEHGYIPDIVSQIEQLLPVMRETGVKIITNGGGTNCAAAMDKTLAVAARQGYGDLIVGAVSGDNVTAKLDELMRQGWKFTNLDTGEDDLSEIRDSIVSAHAYIGADGIVEALRQDADVVIAGRVSDNALYVGPLMHEFGWSFEPAYVDRIGAAIALGHIVECAELVCGGMSNLWRVSPEPWNIGFPIAEVSSDGSAIVAKLPGTGGILNEWTVKEHLVYEVHDPSRYVMPDGIADLTALRIQDLGETRVHISGGRGLTRPDTLKVQIGYRDGFAAEVIYLIGRPNVLEKAAKAEEIYRGLLARSGIVPLDLRFDRIGVDAISGGMFDDPPESDVRECGFRIALRTRTLEEATIARAHFLRVTLYGPVGVGWGAPPAVRPVISLWPTLIPRDAVDISVDVRKASA
jgi:hypothetical protein